MPVDTERIGKTMETVRCFDRDIPLLGYWEAVVVGGGSAGASAGIACAQAGLSTLIVEKSLCLGGASVNALVSPMMRSFTGHHSNFHALEARLRAQGCQTRDDVLGEMVWFTPEDMSEALETLYIQAGGQMLYEAVLVDCAMEGGQIRALILAVPEGLRAVAETAHGDENGNDQITSFRFEMGGINVERYRDYVMGLGDAYSQFPRGYFYESAMVGGRDFVLEPLFQKGVRDGALRPEDLRYYQTFSLPGRSGCLSFNCPHLVNLTDNTQAMKRSAAIVEGRAMIRRLARFLKGNMREASMLGVRESYRLVGKYVLTEEDYTGQARFPDGVARGDWYIDVHSATKGLYHKKAYEKGDYYEIPYRSMVCAGVGNLAVAGRCISTTFLMQASVRIIPTCMDMGQAAGAACAAALRDGIALNAVDGVRLREGLDYQ